MDAGSDKVMMRMDSPGRSDHTAFIKDSTLYVWGGCESVSETETVLPSDEIWLYDLDAGRWEKREMAGEVPPPLLGFCGSYHNGTFYVFGGCEPMMGHSNQLYSVDVTEDRYIWKRVTDARRTAPSPRDKHSCWVHRDRLIYFGGYGCKTMREATDSKSFIVDEMSWTVVANTFFRFWGWNNEVHVFDTHTSIWSEPDTRGPAPSPRASHASASQGGKGYICGGLETKSLDMHCLDLDTWTWTCITSELPSSCVPMGRSMHTLTPASDHKLFLFGGLGITGESLRSLNMYIVFPMRGYEKRRSWFKVVLRHENYSPLDDGWEFDTQTVEWREREHQHSDKPRLWHSACQGKDDEVVVFGGSSDLSVVMDSVIVLRSQRQNHCKDVLVFQTQPYSLLRLCEDCIGRNAELLGEGLTWLPPKLQDRVNKRVTFFFNSPTLIEKKQQDVV